MYRHIFKYELKKMIADRTLWVLSIILFMFTILSIFNGSAWINFQLKSIDKIESGQRYRLEKHIKDIKEYNAEHDFIGVGAPHNVSSIGTYTMHYIVKPPHPNALFAIGQSDLYPYYIRFSSIDRSNMLINEEIANPVNLLIGKLDFSFFVIYLLPLLIIAMTYELLASERELGTLTLLRIYQPKTLKFLFFKWLFRVFWLLAVLYIGILTGMLVFSPFSLTQYDSGTLTIIGFSTIYVLFWFALCFAINMLGKNSLFNGIALTMFWLFIVFLLPTVINTGMEKRYPLPSRNEQIVRQREVKEDTDEKETYNRYLKKHPEYQAFKSDTVGNSIITKWYPAYIVTTAAIDSINDLDEARFSRALRMQETGLEKLSFISPSLMTNLAFNQIGRNSLSDYENFNDDFKTAQQRWRAFVYDKILRGETFRAEDLGYQSNFIISQYNTIPIRALLLNKLLWILLLSAALMTLGAIQFKKSINR
ncbi:MAG: ABC transporter permease subunit [Sphingobacterium sp.]